VAVRIRLTRMGAKKRPFYRIVVIDGRKRRDGRALDELGYYDPKTEPSVIEIDTDKARDWLRKGAQPSDAVRRLLFIKGVLASAKGKKLELREP